MGRHTETLRKLAGELFDSDKWKILQRLCNTEPLDYSEIVTFDQSLGGPSILGIVCNGHGRYEAQDRDVFRPLQYCSMHFRRACKERNIEWTTRDIVEMLMSGHIYQTGIQI